MRGEKIRKGHDHVRKVEISAFMNSNIDLRNKKSKQITPYNCESMIIILSYT